MAVTVAPLASSSEAAVARSSELRSAMATMAPREASMVAVARPIPDAAPVIAITLPLKLVDMLSLLVTELLL